MKMTVNVAMASLVFGMGIPAFAQQEGSPAATPAATQTTTVKTRIAPASVEQLNEKVKALNTTPAQPVSEIIKMTLLLCTSAESPQRSSPRCFSILRSSR